MKRAALLGCLLALGVGCAENTNSLIIMGFLDPGSSTCMPLTPTGTRLSTQGGILDVGLGYSGYGANMVALNNLAQRATIDTGERDFIEVTDAYVTLIPPQTLASALPSTEYRVPLAVTVLGPGGQTGTTSLGVVSATVIPFQFITAGLAASVPVNTYPLVQAQIRLRGTHAGQEVFSATTTLPVTLCKFCLATQPTACPMAGVPSAQIENGACNSPGQDYPVTCCTSGNQLLCGDRVPKAM